MEVCIAKPDRIFFKEDAEELLLPTSTGYIGILQEHAPLVTGLDNGVLALRQGTSWKILALLGGFGVIKENRVNILCRDIEDAADIDVDEAERRVAEARTGMEKAESRKIYIENQLTFDRERARIEAHTDVEKLCRWCTCIWWIILNPIKIEICGSLPIPHTIYKNIYRLLFSKSRIGTERLN